MLSLEGGEIFFAKTLANSDDAAQGKFFNEFGRLLRYACKQGLGMDSQLCYIAAKLDKDGKEVVGLLAKFCKD